VPFSGMIRLVACSASATPTAAPAVDMPTIPSLPLALRSDVRAIRQKPISHRPAVLAFALRLDPHVFPQHPTLIRLRTSLPLLTVAWPTGD